MSRSSEDMVTKAEVENRQTDTSAYITKLCSKSQGRCLEKILMVASEQDELSPVCISLSFLSQVDLYTHKKKCP